MAWKPDITVAAIITRGAQFLVVEELIQGQRVINQPAGHVEANESPHDAVIREVLEETTWQFLPQHIVGVYLWRKPGSTTDTLRIAYCGELGTHDPTRRLDQPVIANHWLSRTDLAAMNGRLRTPLVLRCIDDFLAGRRLPLDVLADLRALQPK
jgi:8-oxo-dGTP pyrophosphatase MutT (NUDIX family)